jgi:hypothetical protein
MASSLASLFYIHLALRGQYVCFNLFTYHGLECSPGVKGVWPARVVLRTSDMDEAPSEATAWDTARPANLWLLRAMSLPPPPLHLLHQQLVNVGTEVHRDLSTVHNNQ